MASQKNILHRIRHKYAEMGRAEKAVADYVLNYPEDVVLLSMRALAEKANVSDNTVLRFCRTSGFSGYWDFKSSLVPQIVVQRKSIYQPAEATDQFALQHKKISANICTAIQETFQNINEEDIIQVAQKIVSSNITVIIGLGDSYGVAIIFSNFLLMLGLPSICMRDRSEMVKMGSILGEDSILIALTHSGETPEVLMTLERAAEQGAFTTVISNSLAVKHEVQPDIFLLTQVPATSVAGSYFALPRIAQLAVIELILSKMPFFYTKEE
jgi:DNA-binding MurR/RpiR family transcriptional regulator